MTTDTIVTIKSPNPKIDSLTFPYLKAYADKIKSKIIFLDKLDFDNFNKIKADRILFISPACLVRPDTPNLFDIAPVDGFSAMKESRFNIDERMYHQCKLNDIENTHYSLDVFCMPTWMCKYLVEGPEHFQLFMAMHAKQYTQDLQYKFNRIPEMDKPSGEHRLSSYIINYSFMISNPEMMEKVITEDIADWESNPTFQRKQYVALFMDGCGLGDVTCTEPVARYCRDHLYVDEDFIIITDKPELFKHLNVPIYGNNDKVPNSSNYYVMKCFGDVESPVQGQYLSHSQMHCIDFCSFMAFRRQIPLQLKPLQMYDYSEDEDIKESLYSKIKPKLEELGITEDVYDYLKRSVLVHAGKHWDSKTFPRETWESWTQAINDKNLPVINVGKTIEKHQGIVAFDIPKTNSLDLVDQLSLKELIAVIRLCPILLTNDSAPIHIAGAFDNWIIPILTCKDAEYVMPFRKNKDGYVVQDYKVKMFERMVFSVAQHRPNQIDGFKIDYVPPADVLKVIPTTEEIIEAVVEAYYD
jgi:hypothetical protein